MTSLYKTKLNIHFNFQLPAQTCSLSPGEPTEPRSGLLWTRRPCSSKTRAASCRLSPETSPRTWTLSPASRSRTGSRSDPRGRRARTGTCVSHWNLVCEYLWFLGRVRIRLGKKSPCLVFKNPRYFGLKQLKLHFKLCCFGFFLNYVQCFFTKSGMHSLLFTKISKNKFHVSK